MNVSHTIKDKEIPRWQPLQRVPQIALAKLSPKRIVLLFLGIATLLFLLSPKSLHKGVILDPEKQDESILTDLRKELNSLLTLKADFSTQKKSAIILTAHSLSNATGLTSLACDLSHSRKMNILLLFMSQNSSSSLPFWLRANQFVGSSTCPMTWFDARHLYSTMEKQQSATEVILGDMVRLLDPSVVVYVDDEEDWFMQSLERVVYWRRPAISLIQLKRNAIPNLRWIASLSPAALAGISPFSTLNSYGVNSVFSMEYAANRYCNNYF